MSEEKYLKIMRGVAWFDFFFSISISFPAFARGSIQILTRVHQIFGLPGSIPAFDNTHLIFLSSMGFMLMFWALFRLRYSEFVFGLWDSFLRAFLFISTAGLVMGRHLSLIFSVILALQFFLLLLIYINYIRMRLYQVKDDDHDHE